jgi:hypothetical protein
MRQFDFEGFDRETPLPFYGRLELANGTLQPGCAVCQAEHIQHVAHIPVSRRRARTRAGRAERDRPRFW